MVSLYKAIVKRLGHEHDFKLINDSKVFEKASDTLPIQIIKTYICKCGKVKKVTIGQTITF